MAGRVKWMGPERPEQGLPGEVWVDTEHHRVLILGERPEEDEPAIY